MRKIGTVQYPHDGEHVALQVYEQLFSDATEERIEKLFDYLDCDHSGYVDYLSWSRAVKLEVRGWVTQVDSVCGRTRLHRPLEDVCRCSALGMGRLPVHSAAASSWTPVIASSTPLK